VEGGGCMVHGAWCMVHGAWCRVQGEGWRVEGAGLIRVGWTSSARTTTDPNMHQAPAMSSTGRKCWPWNTTRVPPYAAPFEGSSLVGGGVFKAHRLLYHSTGLVFKAHRLVYHSTLGLRVIKKRRSYRMTDGAGMNSNASALEYSTPSCVTDSRTRMAESLGVQHAT